MQELLIVFLVGTLYICTVYVLVHYIKWLLLGDMRDKCERCEYRNSVLELQESLALKDQED